MKKKLFLIPLLVSVMTLSGCVHNEDKTVHVTGVTLNEKTHELKVNESFKLVPTINPDNATDKTVTWSCSDETVVSVSDDGTVKALKTGESTVAVTTKDGHFIDNCKFTVIPAEDKVPVAFGVVNYNDVQATVDKEEAYPGEDITITITKVREGFTLGDINLYNSDFEIIPHQSQVGNDLQFTYQQPANGICKLEALLSGNPIKAYITDEHSLMDGNPQMSTDGGKTYGTVGKGGEEGGRSYWTFNYGATIKMALLSTDDFEAKGVKVDGVLHQVDKDNVATFTVEVEDMDEFFLDIKVEAEYKKPVGGEYEFAITNSSHITLKTYKEDKKTELAGANQNDTVYVKATSDSEDYGVREVKVTYATDDMGHLSQTSVTNKGDGWYSFKCPYAHDKKVRISVVEANNTVLKNSEAVGKYMTISISNATRSFDEFDTRTVTIAKDGVMNLYNGDSVSRTDIAAGDDGSTLTTEGVSPSYVQYGDNFLFFSTDGDTGFKTPFGGYNLLCVKMSKEEDAVADYTVHGERFLVEDDRVFVSVTVQRNGADYASAFIRFTEKVAIYGVSYNMIKGTNVNDDIVLYEVFSKDHTKQAVIGSNGTGTYTSRCLMGPFYGTYIKDSDTLELYSSMKALFNGDSYNYSVTGNEMVLTSSTRELTLTIDDANKTFTIDNDKSLVLDLPEFAGKGYRTTGLEDDSFYYNFYIEFSATDMKMSTVGGGDYNLDMDHHSTQEFALNRDVDYAYDKDTKIVTATIKIKGGSYKTVKFKYTTDSEGKVIFTAQAKDLGNFYSREIKFYEVK